MEVVGRVRDEMPVLRTLGRAKEKEKEKNVPLSPLPPVPSPWLLLLILQSGSTRPYPMARSLTRA